MTGLYSGESRFRATFLESKAFKLQTFEHPGERIRILISFANLSNVVGKEAMVLQRRIGHIEVSIQISTRSTDEHDWSCIWIIEHSDCRPCASKRFHLPNVAGK
ncbi:hypothetical protein C2S51_014361 [Perilla frutescens var. frutescens]|nr:hypothetical protein C2S51_014361 [Perilla frutescens var. frutescens]